MSTLGEGLPDQFRHASQSLRNLMDKTQEFRAAVQDGGGRLPKTEADEWAKLQWDVRRTADEDVYPVQDALEKTTGDPVSAGGLTRPTLFELIFALARRSEDAALLLVGCSGKKPTKTFAKNANFSTREGHEEILDGMLPISRQARDGLLSQLECDIRKAALSGPPVNGTDEGHNKVTPPVRYSKDDLRNITSLGDSRLTFYTKRAGVEVPGPGRNDFRWDEEQVRLILNEIVDGTRESVVKAKCKEWLSKHGVNPS